MAKIGDVMQESKDELQRQLDEKTVECMMYRRQLEKAVDKLVEVGVIDNLPHTKYKYASGQREL